MISGLPFFFVRICSVGPIGHLVAVVWIVVMLYTARGLLEFICLFVLAHIYSLQTSDIEKHLHLQQRPYHKASGEQEGRGRDSSCLTLPLAEMTLSSIISGRSASSSSLSSQSFNLPVQYRYNCKISRSLLMCIDSQFLVGRTSVILALGSLTFSFVQLTHTQLPDA